MNTQYTSAVPAIVPDEEDLPGWVPKNYIEKGMLNYWEILSQSEVDLRAMQMVRIIALDPVPICKTTLGNGVLAIQFHSVMLLTKISAKSFEDENVVIR